MSAKKIAITGGIGSGKSLVLDIVRDLGYHTLSSDQIVGELYKKRRVLKRVKKLFPTAVKGFIKLSLDRRIVSEQAFSDTEKHRKLTDLITPMVINQIEKRAKGMNGLLFVEVPLLFECNYQTKFDRVWVITRPLEQRIESVKLRSNLTESQILARMAKQVNYDTLDLSPYTVIENCGDKKALKQKISDILL